MTKYGIKIKTTDLEKERTRKVITVVAFGLLGKLGDIDEVFTFS